MVNLGKLNCCIYNPLDTLINRYNKLFILNQKIMAEEPKESPTNLIVLVLVFIAFLAILIYFVGALFR
jgi:hypothetical protein